MLTMDEVIEAMAEAESALFYYCCQNADDEEAGYIHEQVKQLTTRFWQHKKKQEASNEILR